MPASVFEITKSAQFDAAHFLLEGPDPAYRRVHGHSFQVEATVRGEAAGPVGWVADLGKLDRALKAAAARLDHGTLNDVDGLESPTLERLCLWFADQLRGEFPNLSRVTVARPTVGERCALDL